MLSLFGMARLFLNLAEAAVELSTYGVNDYLAVAQVAFDLLRSIHGGLPAKTMDLRLYGMNAG